MVPDTMVPGAKALNRGAKKMRLLVAGIKGLAYRVNAGSASTPTVMNITGSATSRTSRQEIAVRPWRRAVTRAAMINAVRVEQQIVDALAKMMMTGEPGDDPEEDFRDRARMILASSAFLAKMVFDGVSEKRRRAFVQHVLEPLTADYRP